MAPSKYRKTCIPPLLLLEPLIFIILILGCSSNLKSKVCLVVGSDRTAFPPQMNRSVISLELNNVGAVFSSALTITFFFFFFRQFNSYRSGGTRTRLNGFDLIGLNNVGLKTYRKWSLDAHKLIYEFVL